MKQQAGLQRHSLPEGDVFVGGVEQEEMMTFLNVYRKVGGEFEVFDDGIRFWHAGKPLKPVTIETDVHPGFMTDWQQPLVVALTKAQGVLNNSRNGLRKSFWVHRCSQRNGCKHCRA